MVGKMNSKDIRTLNGVDTDIKWIIATLERLEGKQDKHEKITQSLVNWKWKIIGISIGGSTVISTLILTVTLFLKFIK